MLVSADLFHLFFLMAVGCVVNILYTIVHTDLRILYTIPSYKGRLFVYIGGAGRYKNVSFPSHVVFAFSDILMGREDRQAVRLVGRQVGGRAL